MITLDTSAVVAYLNRSDEHHGSAMRAFASDAGPLVVPVPILAEITYLLDLRAGQRVLTFFLDTLIDGYYELDRREVDLPRVRELVARYADLPLGFADAAVVAGAERQGGRVLTYDRRHFPVVAGEGTIPVVG